jgi:Flp pilus assembly protein TadB
MTSQSRVSTISILGATYFIALIMWRNDPARMIGFLTSPIGKTLVAGALALQAIGVVWAARLSRVKF